MRFAVNVPNFGDYADPRTVASFAAEAEVAGWDGFFVWDHIVAWDGVPVGDAWVHLAAVATATVRIRLGPLVTPLPRRRPWVVARQAVALDHLSGGRLTLGVGLGEPPEEEFGVFGEETDARVRAAKLDEALEVIVGMWRAEPFSFEGEHYRVSERTFLPRPVQRPRIPIWVGGGWPRRGPFRRAARFDGVAALRVEEGEFVPPTPDDVRAIVAYVAEHRQADGPFDVSVALPVLEPSETTEHVAALEEVGATWCQVSQDPFGGETLDAFRDHPERPAEDVDRVGGTAPAQRSVRNLTTCAQRRPNRPAARGRPSPEGPWIDRAGRAEDERLPRR